ncbi:MAG: 30S ribosomal protein S1, partial [Deltaproteobacteria bacterium]|nr:30S ribosomal protein S1 [Deltaproteobacteria bacterium]
MDETRIGEEHEAESDSFAQMVDQSLSGLKEGEVVSGRVVEVTPVAVVVDIGYKAEGEIPLEEFLDGDGKPAVKPGDMVEVLIESHFTDGEEEIISLSRRRAGEAQAWEQIEKAYRDESTIKGTIASRVKGGFRVEMGVPAFLPGSQVDLRPVKDLDSVLGQEYEFKVLKYSRRRRNIVLSRRVILEEERQGQKIALMATLAEGQVITGVVKNVVKYGAFIDLGGMDGLLHISDMSWGRIQYPGDLVSVGDELEVMILKFDQERERISLGLKQLTSDPWSQVEENYKVGTKVEGRVVNVVDYGAFLEIEPGLEGLIHITEMSWAGNIRQAKAVLDEGQTVEAVVISLDTDARKLALSLKRIEPDPWQTVAERYPPETIIEGRVKTVTEFGVFIGLEEGVDGLVHRKDMSWAKNPPPPEELYQDGQEIQAVVLAVDPEKKKIALGIKQLSEDPWPKLVSGISLGRVLNGTVTSLTDFGVFVEVSDGVEGLIQADQDEEASSPELNVGQEIEVRVLELQPEKHRLS